MSMNILPVLDPCSAKEPQPQPHRKRTGPSEQEHGQEEKPEYYPLKFDDLWDIAKAKTGHLIINGILDMLSLPKKCTLRKRVESIVNNNHDHYSFAKKMVSIAGKSGGVLTVMCPHSTCLGFKVLYLHEGHSDYVQFLRSWKHIPTICIVDFAPHVARHGEKQFPGMFAPFGGKLTNPKNPQILEFIKSGGLVSHEELWTPKSVIPAPLVNPVHPVTNTPFKYVCFDRFHEVNSKIPIDILHRLDICVQLKNKINTSACEQMNKELSRYQSSLTNMSGLHPGLDIYQCNEEQGFSPQNQDEA